MRPVAAARETTPALEISGQISGSGGATSYALNLIQSLGWRAEAGAPAPDPSPSDAWARSGAMALTGTADGPGLPAPAAVASCADGAGRALVALARAVTGIAPEDLDGAELLGERAACAEPPLERAGRISPGGSARMIACADGWLALNLARTEDVALLPAWLETEPGGRQDPWEQVATCAAGRSVEALVGRGRLMGLAVAPVAAAGVGETPWYRVACEGARRPPREGRPLVVDLSALWAGPLCGQLLAECGSRVIKVESIERPDGARRGNARFFDLLNGQKESVALSFRDPGDLGRLTELLSRADIVIESSRPRALGQLGIQAESFVEEHGVTWVGLTGYGRQEPEAGWVAFGDDAAAAAGLVATAADGTPCFCGDAIADPLAGLHAAVASLATWAGGRARLVDISLYGVAAEVRRFQTSLGEGVEEPAPARARAVRRHARVLGRDTEAVRRELEVPC